MSPALALKGFLLRPFDERSMRETLAFSALAHAALFFASTLVAWLLPRTIEPFPSTRVEVVSEAELRQRIKAYRADTTTQPKKSEPLQQEEPSAPDSAPSSERVAVEETPTTPSLKTQQAVEPDAAQHEPKPDPTLPKEETETEDSLIASLEAASEEASLDESLDEALTDSEAEPDPSFLTSESVLTSAELSAFRRHITRCWSPPIGAPALENLVVDLLLTIDEQAHVIDALVIDRARMGNDPFFRSAAEAALRTISDKACSPLRLPLEKHALWKKTILRFDPRSLFGN